MGRILLGVFACIAAATLGGMNAAHAAVATIGMQPPARADRLANLRHVAGTSPTPLNPDGDTSRDKTTLSEILGIGGARATPYLGTPYLGTQVGDTISLDSAARIIGYQAATEWKNQAATANFFCGVDDSGGPLPSSPGTNFGCGRGSSFANGNVPFWLYDSLTDTFIWNHSHTIKLPYGSGASAADSFDIYSNSDGNTFGVLFENPTGIASGNYVWFSQFCNNPGGGTTCGDNGPLFDNGRDQITLGAVFSGGDITHPAPCVDGSHFDLVTTEQYGRGAAAISDVNAKITLITNNNGSACSSTENGMDMQVWLTPHAMPQSDITKVFNLDTSALTIPAIVFGVGNGQINAVRESVYSAGTSTPIGDFGATPIVLRNTGNNGDYQGIWWQDDTANFIAGLSIKQNDAAHTAGIGFYDGDMPTLVGDYNETATGGWNFAAPTILGRGYRGGGNAAIPACSVALTGARAAVTDGAERPAFGGTYSAGAGRASQPVYCNGAHWVYGLLHRGLEPASHDNALAATARLAA